MKPKEEDLPSDASSQVDLISAIHSADQSYLRRTDVAGVRDSVLLLSSVSEGMSRYEVLWRMSRALFFLRQEGVGDSWEVQLDAMRTGAWAVAESPDRVEGRFWLGVNLSIAAQELGRLKAMRAILEAKAELKKAEKIAPAYHGAGPLRVLGRIYHKAPWFVGGSNKRSRQYYDRALEIAPSNSVTLIYAAELALDMKEHERAVSLLEKIISSPIDPEWEHENLRDRRLAENLLDRLRKG